MASRDDVIVMVCDKCLTAICWHGEMYCPRALNAGTTKRTVRELRKLGREDESNWSESKLTEIYGEAEPFGRKRNPAACGGSE